MLWHLPSLQKYCNIFLCMYACLYVRTYARYARYACTLITHARTHARTHTHLTTSFLLSHRPDASRHFLANFLSISHTRANCQAESSMSYELGWFSVNRQRFPVHSWQVRGPTEIVGVCSVGQWQRGTFFSGIS